MHKANIYKIKISYINNEARCSIWKHFALMECSKLRDGCAFMGIDYINPKIYSGTAGIFTLIPNHNIDDMSGSFYEGYVCIWEGFVPDIYEFNESTRQFTCKFLKEKIIESSPWWDPIIY